MLQLKLHTTPRSAVEAPRCQAAPREGRRPAGNSERAARRLRQSRQRTQPLPPPPQPAERPLEDSWVHKEWLRHLEDEEAAENGGSRNGGGAAAQQTAVADAEAPAEAPRSLRRSPKVSPTAANAAVTAADAAEAEANTEQTAALRSLAAGGLDAGGSAPIPPKTHRTDSTSCLEAELQGRAGSCVAFKLPASSPECLVFLKLAKAAEHQWICASCSSLATAAKARSFRSVSHARRVI